MGFEVSLRRAIAAFRLASLVYAGNVSLHNVGHYDRPYLGWCAYAIMVIWTVVITAAYARGGMRRWQWLAGDLAMGAALVLATGLVEQHSEIVRGAQTVSGPLSVVPVAAWAVAWGPLGGVTAGLVICCADIIERGAFTVTVASNCVYVLL